MITQPDDRPAPILWTPRQAAAALQISERTLYAWSKGGRIPSVRVGRTVRYCPDRLQKWIREQEATQ